MCDLQTCFFGIIVWGKICIKSLIGLKGICFYSKHFPVVLGTCMISLGPAAFLVSWKVLGYAGIVESLPPRHAAQPHSFPGEESVKACHNTPCCLPGLGLLMCLDMGY